MESTCLQEHMPTCRLHHPRMVWAFAVMPSFDAILNQIANYFHPSVGPLSLLEIVRGTLVLLYLAVIASQIRNAKRQALAPFVSISLGLFVFLVILCRDALTPRGVTVAGIASYFQIAYWILTWATVTLVCKTPSDFMVILRGSAIGAVITAVSVIMGVWLGGLNPYELDSVTASTGWFNSPKNITAILVIGSVLCPYLFRRSRILALLGTCLCASACLITYARAGAVALCVVFIWICSWGLVSIRQPDRRWAVRYVIPLLVGISIVFLALGPKSLLSRWSDFSDRDRAGSGRASFWAIAIDAYEKGDTTEKILGNGYDGMGEILLREYGDDIKHTHNDFLDVLMVGGIVALAWFVIHLAILGVMALRTDVGSSEFAVSVAVLLTYMCHSLFTGQLFSTDASTFYVVCLTCLAGRTHISGRQIHWEAAEARLGAVA